jgi:hypothetical protein
VPAALAEATLPSATEQAQHTERLAKMTRELELAVRRRRAALLSKASTNVSRLQKLPDVFTN